MYVTQGQSSYIDSCISTTNSTNIWIPKTCLTFSGTGSVSSGSAKSVSTQRSELDESFSSSASFPNSPATAAGQQPTGQHQRRGLATPTTKRHLPQGLPVVVGINRCIVSLPVKVARSTGAICQNDSGKVNLFLDRDCIATIQMTTYI